jgi:hypothetical protein
MGDAPEIKDDLPEIEVVHADESESSTAQHEAAGDEGADEPKKEVAPQEGIQELKNRLEAEKAARAEAERRAHAAWLESERQKVSAQDSNYQMVLSAVSTVEQRAKMLRSAFSEAMTAGDYDKAGEIQEAIATNAANLNDLKKGQRAMEDAAERAKKEKPAEPLGGDAIDQWAASVTPRSANWLRSNKAAISTPAMQKRVLLAHGLAADEGIEPDSDAYFEFIERNIGLRKEAPKPRVIADDEGTADSPLSSASAPAPRRSVSPPAAPVSRGTGRTNVVRLSADEREAARISGLSEEEYARNKEKIRRGAA